jgi:hypothetical protein
MPNIRVLSVLSVIAMMVAATPFTLPLVNVPLYAYAQEIDVDENVDVNEIVDVIENLDVDENVDVNEIVDVIENLDVDEIVDVIEVVDDEICFDTTGIEQLIGFLESSEISGAAGAARDVRSVLADLRNFCVQQPPL